MVNAAGELTDDRESAVRGEVIETMPDGTKRSTSFTVDQVTEI